MISKAQYNGSGSYIRMASILPIAVCCMGAPFKRAVQEFMWPPYAPTVAYDDQEEFGVLDPPAKVLDDVHGDHTIGVTFKRK